jgi:hypothetical protein
MNQTPQNAITSPSNWSALRENSRPVADRIGQL